MTDDSAEVAVELDQVKLELAFGVAASLIGVYLGSAYEVGAPWLWATDACADPTRVCGVLPFGPLLVVVAVVLVIGVVNR